MKNVILIVINMMIAVLTFGILMTLDARVARQQELASNLSSITEEVIGNAMQEDNYKIENYNCFIADLIENLAVALDAESDITIRIMKADIQKGILSIEVVERYRHLNGRIGTVSCQKTVIFNQLVEPEEISYKVEFYLSKEELLNQKNSYKIYTIKKGDTILQPKIPVKDAYTFKGWYDKNGVPADFSQGIEQDICYYAQWKLI